ncbi:hypothetical protein TNCV_2041751 [Trichonephila clavipes]|nr:hypothetical protein TNCV_2041751 [Trichonephila clavipes]
MQKKQTCITCTAAQMVTAQLRYECMPRSFLIDECWIIEFFSCYITFMKYVRSTKSDMILVDEELYIVQAWNVVTAETAHLSCCSSLKCESSDRL